MGFGKYVPALLSASLCSAVLVAATAKPKEISKRSLTTLMDQGEQALMAKDYKAARDDFSDVLSADPRNPMALEGATLAYLKLDDYVHAKATLEKALVLQPHPSRSSAINGAAIYLHTKIPMRSVKLLIEYMTPMTSVDEDALNAMAVSLNQADEQARKGRIYSDAVNFYNAQTKKLEQQNSGMKRWGTQWLAAEDADGKMTAWNKAVASSTKLGRDLAALKAHLAMVERGQNDPVFIQKVQIQNYQRQYGIQNTRVEPINELTLSKLQPEVEAKQAEYDQAMQVAERPPIPDSIDPVNINSVATPSFAKARDPGDTALAAASQDSATTERPKVADVTPAPTTNRTKVAIAKHPHATPAPAAEPKDSMQPPDSSIPAALPASTAPSGTATSGDTSSPPADAAEAPRKTYHVSSYSAAFAVGPNLLVTSAESVADASDIQIQIADGNAFPAKVVRSDTESGLALLSVPTAKFTWLNLADQFVGGTVSCVSFPSVDLFQPSAALIAGSATSPKEPWHVRLSEAPRLAGGPLLFNGKVVGVELATRDSEIGAIPAVTLAVLKNFLASDFSPGGTAADGVAATVQLTATREK